MKKMGQVTLFVILAIVIVVGIVSFFIFKDNLFVKGDDFDVSEVKLFVDDCIERVGEEVILKVTEGGGYYLTAENSLDNGIPIYFDSDGKYIPSLKDIEDEIDFFVAEKLFFCTRNFVDFSDFQISQEGILVESEILDDEIKMNVYYPINIRKGESKVLLNKFNGFVFSYKIKDFYNFAVEYLNMQDNTKGICLTCLEELSSKYNIKASVFDADESGAVFILKDLGEEKLEYVFGIDFGGQEE